MNKSLSIRYWDLTNMNYVLIKYFPGKATKFRLFSIYKQKNLSRFLAVFMYV